MSFGFIAFGLGASAATATTIGVAGATLASTAIAAKSAKKAGERQTAGQERALGLTQERDVRTSERLSPFIRGETPAQQEQQALIGLLGPEARAEAEARLETPTTRAIREEGLGALEGRFAASGGIGGSNRLNALLAKSGEFDRRFKSERLRELSDFNRSRLGPIETEAGFGASSTDAQGRIIQNIGATGANEALATGEAFRSGVEGAGSLLLASDLDFGRRQQANTSGVGDFKPGGFGTETGRNRLSPFGKTQPELLA